MLNEVKHLYPAKKTSRREEGFFALLRMTFREVLIMENVATIFTLFNFGSCNL